MAELTFQDTVLEDQEILDYFDGTSLIFDIKNASGPLVVTLAPNPEGAPTRPEATLEKEDHWSGRVVFRNRELEPHFPENSIIHFFVWEFDGVDPTASDPVLRAFGKAKVRPAPEPSIVPGTRATPTIDSTRITIDSTNFTIDEAA